MGNSHLNVEPKFKLLSKTNCGDMMILPCVIRRIVLRYAYNELLIVSSNCNVVLNLETMAFESCFLPIALSSKTPYKLLQCFDQSVIQIFSIDNIQKQIKQQVHKFEQNSIKDQIFYYIINQHETFNLCYLRHQIQFRPFCDVFRFLAINNWITETKSMSVYVEKHDKIKACGFCYVHNYIYIFGGYINGFYSHQHIRRYNITNQTFEVFKVSQSKRCCFPVCVHLNNQIFLFGWIDCNMHTSREILIFDIKKNDFLEPIYWPCRFPIEKHAISETECHLNAIIYNNLIYLFNAMDGLYNIFNPLTYEWSFLELPLGICHPLLL